MRNDRRCTPKYNTPRHACHAVDTKQVLEKRDVVHVRGVGRSHEYGYRLTIQCGMEQ